MYPWGNARPYHSYAAYCRRTFGRPIQKLPVDGGFTCPNRDGTVGHGGCSFCSNEAFTPAYCDPRRTVRQQVDDAIAFHRRGFPAGTGFLVYFQSYSNTYAPLERLQRLFGEALACPGVAGIVVGTRPDCVDAAKLDYLADLARRTYVCVEYGIESTSDATLRTIDRGHDFAAARRAVEATAARGVAVGAHFILGLPDESDAELLDRTRIINALPLATVKFHQLQCVEGTRMTDLYDAEPARFRRWTAAEYGGTEQSPVQVYTRDTKTFFDPEGKDVIAYGEVVFTTSVDEWREFTVKLDYTATDVVPTHLIIVCSASRYGDYFTGSSDSVMWVDDFELVYE